MSRPWMPLYIADYLQDTTHLSAAEHGAYLLLIMHYWANGGLPTDDRRLARIARMSDDEWAVSKETIAEFFEADWKHIRIEVELVESDEKYERRASAGAAGGRASGKSRRKRSIASGLLQADANQTRTNAEPTTTTTTIDSEVSTSGADAPPIYTDSRHELWGEGVPILVSLGVSNREARSNIGRWLKSTSDDAQRVLGAIQRARDARVAEPIAWITRAFSMKDGQHGTTQGNGLQRALAKLAANEPGGGDETRPPPPRLLSNG
jgi:uncharacterized protein YdaU (DUF1376 family)